MYVIVFYLIGTISNEKIRRYANDIMFKVSLRLLIRSLSSVVTFHNTEYRPKGNGFCVANHTTPIDVCILGSDHTYSLVRFRRKQNKNQNEKTQNETTQFFSNFNRISIHIYNGQNFSNFISICFILWFLFVSVVYVRMPVYDFMINACGPKNRRRALLHF